MPRPSDKTTVGHEGPALGLPPQPKDTWSDLDSVERPPVSADQQIGRFRVVRKLGAGGMGVVFEAVDPERGARVALKTLRSVEPRAAQRFKNEFRSLADLSHPNVIELYELFATDERLFFTMQLVHGVDLLHWVHAPGAHSAWSTDGGDSPPVPDYGRLGEALRQVVLGVDAIHQHGKLHRDLKPANVLVRDDGSVVVLDFGLVRDATDNDDGLTVSGTILGTPAFMSPEQADGKPLSPASDWYAVGVMLFQALTGKLPHHELETSISVLVAKTTREAPDPRKLVPGTPAELAELCMGLLAIDPDKRPNAAAILDALPEGADRQPARAATMHPFLARDAALATLHGAYNAASLGRTVVTLVQGPSGIGKSSLVDHFLKSLRRRDGEGVVVLRGRCYERESVPYKAVDPVIDHLTRYLRRLEPAAAAALLPREIHALTRLFPALLDVESIDRAPRRVPTDDQELRQRAFGALQELLGRITDRRPLALYVDDLQWTDDDSVALLLHLLRPPDSPHLLLVASFREEDARDGSSPALTRLLEGLGRARPKIDIRRISLGPLPAQHTALLARTLLHEHGMDADLAERIAKESEGNPLLTAELVRHLASAKASGKDATVSSPRLTEVLAERIDGLPEPARRLLEAVAVAGRRLPQVVALAAAETKSEDSDPVGRLRAEHFVRTVGPSSGRRIETYHDRVRQAAVDNMPEASLRATHRRLALALQEQGDADPEHLLEHYRAAGDDDKAGRFALVAADRAADQLAFDRAAARFELALSLEAGDRAKLEARMAEALANAGRGREAADAYLRAADLEDGAVRTDLERRAAMLLLEGGHSEEGRTVLARVLAAHRLPLPKSRGAVLAALLLRRAKLKIRGLGWQEDLDVDSKTLARIDACWSASRGVTITDIIAGGYFQAEHLLLALDSGDPTRVSVALAEEARSASYFGDRGLTRARALLGEVQTLAERIDTPEARANALAAEALVLLMSAQWKESLARNREAETILRDECTGKHQELFDVMAGEAAAMYGMGELPALESLCTKTAAEAKRRNNVYHELMARLFMAVPVALTHDEADEAERILDASEVLSRERSIQVAGIQIQNARTALAIYRGQASKVWESQAAKFAEMRTNPLMRASFPRTEVWSWHGRLALAAAEEDERRRGPLLGEAAKLAKALRRHQFPTASPMGALLRAGIEHLRGRSERAEGELREAADRFEALDMTVWAAASRRRLGMLLGGDRGYIMRERAERSLEGAGVKDLDAFCRVWVPGFPA